ncbi:MAG TPA: hypothetical protein ENK52_01900 [Saprospiraceae bacterium]|nr:hypothetical protein [Saprospiraceae bacterium]
MLRQTLIAVLFLLFSNNVNAKILIPGKVINPIDSVIKLVVLPTELGGERMELTAKLNNNNAFQFTLDSDVAILADVYHGAIGFPIFINPNKAVAFYLTVLDVKQGKVNYKGPGKADNTFFLEYQKFVSTKLENKKLASLKKSKAKEFVAFVQKRQKQKEQFIKNYQENYQISFSKELENWINNDIIYESAELLLKYPQLYYLANQKLKRKELSKKYYHFLENIRINNDSAILQPSYLGFLEGYFFVYRIEKAKDRQLLYSFKNQIKYVERFFIGNAKYYLQSLILLDGINSNPKWVEDEYRKFIVSKAPPSLIQKVKTRYALNTAPIKGKKIPTDFLVNTQGSTPEKDIFNNKITYIFFWSRLDERSLYEKRYMRRLARKFADEPRIQICMISTDRNIDNWKKYIADRAHFVNDPKIKHYLLHPRKALDFKTNFRLKTVPEYYLINDRGRIVSAHTWPPSSGGAARMIRRLLEGTTK